MFEGVDSDFGEGRRPPLGSLSDGSDPGRVHELHVRISFAERRQQLPRGVADPESPDRVTAGIPGRAQDGVDGGIVLQVERELEVGAALVVELSQGRDVLRQGGPLVLPDGLPAEPAALHQAVVVEHGLAVLGQPDVALEPRGAEPQGQAEGLERVLLGVSPGPPVGEPDGRHAEGGEPLLHGPNSPITRCSRRHCGGPMTQGTLHERRIRRHPNDHGHDSSHLHGVR